MTCLLEIVLVAVDFSLFLFIGDSGILHGVGLRRVIASADWRYWVSQRHPVVEVIMKVSHGSVLFEYLMITPQEITPQEIHPSRYTHPLRFNHLLDN